ncbi:hypothetical protein [[Phormidium] sp. ETS-05]|uniref:hypothetical protein n=1 Tax=[Phormidium] sp. ETS-05 TaxID=222819 RepID=UPI0018EF3351|nr:hypothetical protein [[Phormidium] sp. ETS-05]
MLIPFFLVLVNYLLSNPDNGGQREGRGKTLVVGIGGDSTTTPQTLVIPPPRQRRCHY